QATYTWTAATAASGPQTVTATNNSGLTTTGSFTVVNDTTAPTGQTVALAGGPYYTTLSVPLTLGNGTDSGSGINATSGVVERDSAVLSANACGSFSGTWTQVTLVGGADTTVTSGHCYEYRYRISDNVGNQSSASSASASAKVDTSAPSAPSLSFGSFTNASTTGSTVYVRTGHAGAFTVTASSSDAETGVSSYGFPSLGSGWS